MDASSGIKDSVGCVGFTFELTAGDCPDLALVSTHQPAVMSKHDQASCPGLKPLAPAGRGRVSRPEGGS